MKNILRVLIVMVLIASCSSDDGPGNVTIPQNNIPDSPLMNENEEEEETENENISEILIDDSDLANLPEDIGGTNTAYPLSSTSAGFGHYVYTPSGYKEDGPDYPLLIFLHGWSPNLGNEPLDNVLQSGPSSLIENGKWKPKYPFIVVSPQLKWNYWPPNIVHGFIKHLIENYQINTSRIYVTGLSLGGGGCWYYVGEIEDNFAAAIIPISASGSPNLIDNLRKVPIWAFHGGLDNTVKAYQDYGSVPLVQAINATNPEVKAKVTVYPNVGHNAWSRTYDGSGRNYSNQQYDQYDVDLYEWLLQYKKE